jgi:hypothetical protein
VYGIGKLLGLSKIWLARLPPQEVGIRRIGKAARDRVIEAQARGDPEEAFRRPLSGNEGTVTLVDVAG